MFKKLLLAAAVMLGLMAGAVALESPAMAQPVGCAFGQFCTWTGGHYSGSESNWAWSTHNGASGACNSLGAWGGTTIKSAYDDYGSGYAVHLWSGSNCTGTLTVLNPQAFSGQFLSGSYFSFNIGHQ
jgi:hypothetical protein